MTATTPTTLTGSEKQIAWAEDIRAETIDWLRAEGAGEITDEQITAALQWATEAALWIEYRECPAASRWFIVAENGAQKVFPDPLGFGDLPKPVRKAIGAVKQALLDAQLAHEESDD